MPVFLFLKQFVDMLYQFQILDYGMVVFALALLGYKVFADKQYVNIRARLCSADYIVIALGCVYVASFLRYPAAYGTFFKVESAFLIYFLGRAYGEEILKSGRALAAAGYIIIYVNFIYRFYQFGYSLWLGLDEIGLLNRGGLYYYKTDLTVGIMIAVLMIYTFSRIKIVKWLTILPVAGYMVFYSGARMQQAVMVCIYVLILFREIEKKKNKTIGITKTSCSIIMGIIIIISVIFLMGVQILPYEMLDNKISQLSIILEKLMHSRHTVWMGILRYYSEQPFLTRLTGIDLATECLHNASGYRAHSAYIKQIYATGYLGCALMVAFQCSLLQSVTRENNRALIYITVGLWIILLGSGLSIESFEATQMSWFPMLFAGVLITSAQSMKKMGAISESR